MPACLVQRSLVPLFDNLGFLHLIIWEIHTVLSNRVYDPGAIKKAHMSKAVNFKASSLQVVVVPWRQKHFKRFGSGRGKASVKSNIPDSRRVDQHWELFNLNVAFSLFVDCWNTRPQRNWTCRQELNVTFAADRPDLLRRRCFYICVYCHLLNCEVTEERVWRLP